MVNRTRLFPQYVVAMITCCNHRIRRHFQPPHGFLDPVSPPASSIAFPLRFLSNSELVSFFRWCLRHMLGLPNALLLWMFLVWMQIILRLLRFPMLNNPLIGGRHSMPINPTVIWYKCEYTVHFHAFRFYVPTRMHHDIFVKWLQRNWSRVSFLVFQEISSAPIEHLHSKYFGRDFLTTCLETTVATHTAV